MAVGYPGLALEQLILRGDLEAIDLYARWLPVSIYAQLTPSWGYTAPDPRVLNVPKIKQVALDVVRDIWAYANQGRLTDGRLIRAAPVSASTVLNYFKPAWIDDEVLLREVSQWVESSDEEMFVAALHAFDGGPVPASIRALMEPALIARIGSYCRNPNTRVFYVMNWLRAVEQFAIAKAHSLLEVLVSMQSAARLTASAILVSSMDKENGRELARQAAAAGILPERRILAEHHLRILVEAAPDAWFLLAKGCVQAGGVWSSPFVMRLLKHLPHQHQQELARTLLRHIDFSWELPWLAFDEWIGATSSARPADLVSHLLFDTDLLSASIGEE